MREIYVDLSDDKCSPVVFGGYIGEHNETKVVVKLPNRMLTNDITEYKFVFKNSKNEIQSDNDVDLLDIKDGNVSTMLTEEQTIGDCLILSIDAIVKENDIVIRKAKTPTISLKVRG